MINQQSQEERNKVFAEHLKKEHRQSRFAEYLKEIVYGGIDGIITTFAVVAGFSGAATSQDATTTLSFLVVLLFGLANLFADGVSMGLGNFVAVRSDQDLYRASKLKERNEIQVHPNLEREETITILLAKGFSERDARTLVSIYETNEEYWVEWMMKHELEMPNPEGQNPIYTGLATLASFLIFGIIPLIPFIFIRHLDSWTIFLVSSLATGGALFLLGLLKWKIVGRSLLRSLLEVVGLGSVAAVVAFIVGLLFRGL